MSNMNRLSQAADEICEACGELNRCQGCKIEVKQDGNTVTLNGITREILDVKPIAKES